MSEKSYIPTKVYASAEDLPSGVVKEYPQFETNVQLIDLGKGAYCLNHALRLEQIFGGQVLKEAYYNVLDEKAHLVEERLLQAMFDKGFLVPPGVSPDREHRRLMKQEDQKKDISISFTLLRILLTDICNLACSYCKVVQNVASPLTTPTSSNRLEQVIQFFFNNSDPKRNKIIHITGGEPTLFWDSVRLIIDLKEKYQRPNEHIWIVMGTNATRIDDERARYLAEKDVKCIVSMDGPAEIHDQLRGTRGGQGSWEAVDRGIKKLKEVGVEVSISMVLGKHTINEAYSIIDWFLEEYEPTGLGVNFMKPPTPDQKDYEYLIDPNLYADTMYGIHKSFRNKGLFLELVYRKLQPFVEQRYRFHDCGAAGGTNLNVDAKGNVGPCKSFLVMDQLALKDLDSDSYRSTVISQWRKRSPIYYSYCNDCSARGMCGNGCAYDAQIHSGDDMAIDIRSCEYTKRFHELFIEDLFNIVKPRDFDLSSWWHVPSKKEREAVLGNVKARPRTLSYSIGHQTMD
ncbi:MULTISPECIES: radical SAM/SPASM domain-containing protein [unclassified Thermoactinomyces]|uniref:radical SAM/SPASM domain-containing protein n=1 Tax=unclassified Thermoactinomyces TaxID=2634588 RepID=UPI0018DDC52C|nr:MULTISPECIES: radical SAM protein [unclassified Thermoactinomyces]MBH8599054.1 radical SAM protein [Thermoactinomyces sp. CICC 10523]MBH8608015.1 radical SAM protein [Thermoactinomyces sp. CICC 10521]